MHASAKPRETDPASDGDVATPVLARPPPATAPSRPAPARVARPGPVPASSAPAPASDSASPPPATPPPVAAPPAAATGDGRRQASRGASVLGLQARALMHERPDAAGRAVVDQLAQSLGCERVSLGLLVSGRLLVAAVSGAGDLRRRQAGLQPLAAAMNESIDQRSPVIHPMATSTVVALAHGDLARVNGGFSIYTIPVTSRELPIGAMLFERRGGFDAASLQGARDAAMFVAPVLALQHRADGQRNRLAGWLGFGEAPPRGRLAPSARRAIALGSALVLTLAAFVPVPHRVIASARVEGAQQHLLVASADGFIGSVAVRPGETVTAGQVLARLDDRELLLERDKWAAEAAYVDKQYREALSLDDAPAIVTGRAKLEQAQSQVALATRQLDRANLRSPVDGVLIAGDLSQSIGTPVRRGQELMTVASADHFRVVAEVDEQDIAHLRAGQPVQVLFGALPGAALPLAVTRIAPVASQAEGRNVFEVEAEPEAAGGPALRPGMRGVARIEVGEAAVGAIWWERLSNAVRRLSWRLLG